MVGKRGLIAGIFILFLITFAGASTQNDIPTSIALKCSETYSRSFDFNEDINLTTGIMTSANTIQYVMALTKTTGDQVLQISFFPESSYTCYAGSSKFTFEANEEFYEIWVNITEDLWDLGDYTLKKGETLNIGNSARFKVTTVGEYNAIYSLDGCNVDRDDFLDVGHYFDEICEDETLRFWLDNSFPDLNAIKVSIFSSEPGFSVSKDSSDYLEGECLLGLDTMGAKVKRGNIFAIKTINANSNKAIPGVSVTIIDQTGESSPISGQSSNIGFFSERLHEDYPEDLIVQLEKDDCEPSTQIIQFEQSYNDFLESKESEENKKTLKIDLNGTYNSGVEIISTVTNFVDEAIEGVKVKITKPDGTFFETDKTLEDGIFKFTPEEMGIWKLQASKDQFTSSELIAIEVLSSDYILIGEVNGVERVNLRFKNGEEIVFIILDNNNTVIPLTFDAEYGNEILSFVEGESEPVIFNGEASLKIPAIGGYEEEEYIIKKTKGLGWWWVLIGVGLCLIILIVIWLFKRKGKGGRLGSSKSQDSIGFGANINTG